MGRTMECCAITTYYYNGIADCSGTVFTTSPKTNYKIDTCISFPVPGSTTLKSAYKIMKCEEVNLPPCEDT